MRRALLKGLTASRTGDVQSVAPVQPDDGRAIERRPVRVLLVPGFVVDTYSEIEASFVDLSARAPRGLEIIWLVPRVNARAQFVSDARPNITEPVWAEKLRNHGIPYAVGTIHKYNVIANAKLFFDVFRKHRIDVVYTHFGHERFWATLFGKLLGKRTVWNEHWHSLGTRLVTVKRIFFKLFVDEFVAISKFIANSLPSQKTIHTVPNAIRIDPIADADDRLFVKNRCRRELGIPNTPNIRVVLMVAAFRAWKRHDVALEVCRRVLMRCPNVHFIFLGEGPLRPAFQSQATALGIADRIRAPGYMHDVRPFYDAADICMLTSHNEPFGYCVLEAMKYMLPMVAFACGGPAEIIKNGETGILVHDGDVECFARAIIELVQSEETCSRIGRNARVAVEREFSRDVWIKELTRTLSGAARKNMPPIMA